MKVVKPVSGPYCEGKERIGSQIRYVAMVAALYFLGGSIGTLVALPSGYATVIWPASGLALAAVLLWDRRSWPGVFLGSFCINLWIGGAFSSDLTLAKASPAAFIALGATAQATAVAWLVRANFGRPINLKSPAEMFGLFLLAGPAGCTISATVGTAVLFALGIIPAESVLANWAVWWTGDTLGLVLLFPLALMAPWWTEDPLLWKGRPIAPLSRASLALVLISLTLSFYLWVIVGTATQARSVLAFNAVVDGATNAFVARINRYDQGLSAGGGLLLASEHLTRKEWHDFTQEIDISKNLSGISGLGLIVPVPRKNLEEFVRHTEIENGSPFKVHPETTFDELFIIKYIEPLELNAAAVGLDIAFETNRRAAAIAARDERRTILSKPITLVQDSERRPGFLLLRPIYRGESDPGDEAATRSAFLGWAYAPLNAQNMFANLTPDIDQLAYFSVFAAETAIEQSLVFSNYGDLGPEKPPHYVLQRTISVYGRNFTLVWESTPSFENNVETFEAPIVLVAGLIITLLVASNLLSLSNREAAALRLFSSKEQELSAQERLNSSIVDTAKVGIVSTDQDGAILRISKAAAEIFAINPEAPVGQHIGSLIGEDNADLANQVALSGQTQSRRIELERASDDRLVLDIQISAWFSEANDRRFTWVIADVTHQAEVENQLQRTEQRLDAALEGAQIGVFEVDLLTGKSIVSRTWMTLMGFDPDGKTDAQYEWQDRVDKEDYLAVQAADLACIKGEAPRSVSQYRIRRADGIVRWMQSDAIVTERDSSGRALRMIGTQTDITDLTEARAALQTSEATLRGVIDHAPVGMALLDMESQLLDVNDALCEFLEVPKGQLVGARLQDFTHPDDMISDSESSRRLLAGEISSYRCEKRYLRSDGVVVWGLLSVSDIGHHPDRQHTLIAQIQDISEMKSVERLKGDFIASVSHELRTPLTSIKGALGIVGGTMKDSLPEKALHLVSIAEKNSDRLIHLVNDILDMERLGSDQTSFSFSDCDLVDCLAETIFACQPFAHQFDVSLVLERADAPLLARVDSSRLSQVVTNLISNAIKYSPKGGEVKVAVTSVDSSAIITVKDNGKGIPESFRGSMFKPFSQIDMSSTRQVGGTGLGLSISRKIVNRMGGSIDYVSVPGVETVFSVTLPLVDHPGPAAMPVNPGTRLNGATVSRLPQILHIEDDRDFSEVLTAAFGSAAEVHWAENAALAKELLENDSFDLVIIDWEMPDEPRETLLALVKETQNIPVIGLSAQEIAGENNSIALSFVKSRTAMEVIVSSCLDAIAHRHAE